MQSGKFLIASCLRDYFYEILAHNQRPGKCGDRGQNVSRITPAATEDRALPLEFITITEHPEVAKGAYSHVVRSQAMHAFLREKRDESHPITDRTREAKPTKISIAPKTSFSKFKLSTWSRKPNKSKTLPPLKEPNSKALDHVEKPFEVKCWMLQLICSLLTIQSRYTSHCIHTAHSRFLSHARRNYFYTTVSISLVSISLPCDNYLTTGT
jgi:hypothetical protein